MDGMFSLSEWEQRRSALANELEKMQTVYEAESAKSVAFNIQNPPTSNASGYVWQTLVTLVQSLRDFALGYGDPYTDDSLFAHYARGFRDGTLTPPSKYPKEYIMRTLVDQVAYDITVFQFIAGQRWHAQNDPALAEGLAKADKLAQLALEPVCGNFLEPETTALVYLTRVPRARVIPYATVALISLPHTLVSVDSDLLAVAHEAGHHVFWNSQYNVNNQISGKSLAKNPVWRWKWREEIFADVYAAWVAGPCVGLSIQKILGDNLPEEFYRNDEEHPVTVVRPAIYHQILQQHFPTWADHLQNRWEQYKSQFGMPVLSSFLSGTASIDLADATIKMLDFVSAYLDILNSRATQPTTGWHENLGQAVTGQDEKIKTDFETFLNQVALPARPVAISRPVQANYKPINSHTVEEWEEGIKVGGWASKGPEQNFPPWPP